ncbi:MAG: hypothetical protein JST25_10525 [Actinobacteria bacterium]|nr:hypothetical protein [Actinomycetota bacterium]
MTIAAGSEQPTPVDAERPTPGTGPGGLTLLSALDGADAGLCIDGACRLPAAKH